MKEFNLTKENVTNIVTNGCSAFTKGFELFGTCDKLVEHSSTEYDEIPNEDSEEVEQNDSGNELPFIPSIERNKP